MRKKRQKLTPSLDDVLRASPAESQRLLKSMTLGELLAMAGLKIEVEKDGASPEFNAELTRLMESFVPDKNTQ